MAYKKNPSPIPRSLLRKILPLIALFILVSALSFICYQIYRTILKISSATSEKMQKRNMSISKGGAKLSIREIKNEGYVDTTQSFVVKAWNLSNFSGQTGRIRWGSITSGSRRNSEVRRQAT
ncbi:BgTH12-02753 [Blumeria graminis f. sp. triticale]|uniref:BgTH12-02753 n=1 Tax=Blumeria graminis f. sp. triticale TaxID=1689686 RepID=A0A9W4D2Q4_BLUGR|nr:BgTH12-02753 [Blumeria graminis f. sp. triticale]